VVPLVAVERVETVVCGEILGISVASIFCRLVSLFDELCSFKTKLVISL
jgi:hypothetical protein